MTCHPLIVTITKTINDTTHTKEVTVGLIPTGLPTELATAIGTVAKTIIWTLAKKANAGSKINTRYRYAPMVKITIG